MRLLRIYEPKGNSKSWTCKKALPWFLEWFDTNTCNSYSMSTYWVPKLKAYSYYQLKILCKYEMVTWGGLIMSWKLNIKLKQDKFIKSTDNNIFCSLTEKKKKQFLSLQQLWQKKSKLQPKIPSLPLNYTDHTNGR